MRLKNMATLNKVFLIGNLTNDPNLRQTGSGNAVASFGLAVNQRYRGADSEQKKNVCFVDIVVWNKIAEACAHYLKKGKLVFIEGRLHYRSWEQDGFRRSKIFVQARTVQFLKPPEEKASVRGVDTNPPEVPKEGGNHIPQHDQPRLVERSEIPQSGEESNKGFS
jgi:single-strand DNA-binding protein